MSTGDDSVFALWLTLPESAAAPWRRVIEDLARELGGPVFAPHVTLWGSFRRSLVQAREEAEALATELATGLAGEQRPIPLRGAGVGMTDDFYRALFVPLVTTSELWRARRAAGSLLAPQESAEYLPHLSLFYGHQPPERKLEALQRRGALPAVATVAGALSLVSLEGAPETWRTRAVFSFAS